MKEKFKLYLVNMKYVRNLAKKDDNVLSVSPQSGKQDRPFLGIITLINGKKYCIPLTSSNKEKFRSRSTTLDCICIRDNSVKNENAAPTVIGVLNVNNMIPVDKSVLIPMDVKIHNNDSPKEKAQKRLKVKELDWCQKNSDLIQNHAERLYDLIVNHSEQNISLSKRCCRFDVLENVLEKWLQNQQAVNNQSQSSPSRTPQQPTENIKIEKGDSLSVRLEKVRLQQQNTENQTQITKEKSHKHDQSL